jgi:hypothetical protein
MPVDAPSAPHVLLDEHLHDYTTIILVQMHYNGYTMLYPEQVSEYMIGYMLLQSSDARLSLYVCVRACMRARTHHIDTHASARVRHRRSINVRVPG